MAVVLRDLARLVSQGVPGCDGASIRPDFRSW